MMSSRWRDKTLFCTYLAHHELDSVMSIMIMIIIKVRSRLVCKPQNRQQPFDFNRGAPSNVAWHVLFLHSLLTCL